MLEWLEIWLNSFKGGVFIVSHDRTFLDRTVNRIISLDPETHTIKEYAGNYTDYLEAFVKEQEKQLSAWKDQEYEIRRMKQAWRPSCLILRPASKGSKWISLKYSMFTVFRAGRRYCTNPF